MNGLLLPTGSKQPLRGDTSLSISPPSQLKVEGPILLSHVKAKPLSPTATGPSATGFEGPSSGAHPSLTSSHSHTSVSMTSSGLRSPASHGPASLAFIPRTSRNSAIVQKPIHLCSEFELEQRLDRNERILSALETTRSPTKDRLRQETEAIRDAILSLRAMRNVNEGISTVQLNDPSKEAELESALLGLSVKEAPNFGTSPPAETFGWSRDTVAAKKRLAQSSGAYLPGRKVQAIGYEQSLAIQTAALLAERDRERSLEDSRLKSSAATREKPSPGVPSGAAHKLGRKSISSCSGNMRKYSAPHSVSPPKSTRAGGPFARNLDQAPEHDAALEGGDSDQDDAELYDMLDDEEEEDAHPGPRHEDEGLNFGRLDDDDP
ncbi:uncharacterized protein MEPE_00583 [Melanopsichium pennsylvanicum]|uniref:Uncharacterized protein n=2 Tax=Melanopsichium pennsylvanicum TaxID=63383 RepID=A0AAJ4XIQ5_9BASI|nr:conserved hypothetical protein [Melanopsichium pennsylvanicum 4]SNX81878.1 uncharacterized protein MEPE_00583 [Melanopsichium pennsylvanicum]